MTIQTQHMFPLEMPEILHVSRFNKEAIKVRTNLHRRRNTHDIVVGEKGLLTHRVFQKNENQMPANSRNTITHRNKSTTPIPYKAIKRKDYSVEYPKLRRR